MMTRLRSRALLIFFVGLAGWFGVAPLIQACSCIFSGNKSIFISGDHLPANARGVLFMSNEAADLYLESAGDHIELLRAVPPPLTADAFSITEDGSHKSLKVVVQRLHAMDQIDSQQPTRYFRLVDPLYRTCMKERYDGKSEVRCADGKHYVEYGAPVDQLVASGKIQDVSADYDKSDGLFRVGPAGGFEAGKTYVIRFKSKSAEQRAARMGPEQITVTIGPSFAISDQDHFTISLRGQPRRQMLELATGGSCSLDYPMIVQNLGYNIPAAYAPYREALRYFTVEQRPSVAGNAASHEGGYTTAQYRSSVCSQIGFGGSELGAGLELSATSCTDYRQSSPLTRVKGYVGFLEVEDKLHETPVEAIDFGRAKGNACDSFSFLQQAIADQDVEQIRQSVCSIRNVPYQQDQHSPDPKQFVPTLSRLTKDKDPTTLGCADSALVAMTNSVTTLDVQTAQSVATILLDNLGSTNLDVRNSAAVAISTFAAGIRTRMESGNAPTGLNLSILAPAIPVLAKIMIEPNQDFGTSQAAVSTLQVFGPQAHAALPILLNYHGAPDYQLPSLLVAIGPRNPRVFSYLLELVKQERPEAITALGEMGANARAAAPLLFQQAETSDQEYLRQVAMNALTNISDDDAHLVAMITANLKYRSPDPKGGPPHTNYLRQNAIETLAAMETRAKSAAPQLMAVLDANPTYMEYMDVLQALRRIGAPQRLVAEAISRGRHSTSTEIRQFAEQQH